MTEAALPVCVIDPDRRPDRREAMSARLDRLGIEATRISALDARRLRRHARVARRAEALPRRSKARRSCSGASGAWTGRGGKPELNSGFGTAHPFGHRPRSRHTARVSIEAGAGLSGWDGRGKDWAHGRTEAQAVTSRARRSRQPVFAPMSCEDADRGRFAAENFAFASIFLMLPKGCRQKASRA